MENRRKRMRAVLAAAGFFLGLTIYTLTRWYTDRYDTSFAGLLFTLMTPMKGVGSGFWKDFLGGVLPPVLWGTAGYLLLTVLLRSRRIGLMLKTGAAREGRRELRIRGRIRPGRCWG